VHPAAEKADLAIDMCKNQSNMHKSAINVVIDGKDANFVPEFCPERAREG
jgi:hypothetical protein